MDGRVSGGEWWRDGCQVEGDGRVARWRVVECGGWMAQVSGAGWGGMVGCQFVDGGWDGVGVRW
jgi:hypothetical protein